MVEQTSIAMMVAMTTTRAIQSTTMATLETDKQNMAVKDQDVYWWETFDGNNMKKNNPEL